MDRDGWELYSNIYIQIIHIWDGLDTYDTTFLIKLERMAGPFLWIRKLTRSHQFAS